MKKLFIISNESIFESEKKYFCDNLDMKSTPEGLNSHFDVNVVARKSKKARFHEIIIKNINSAGSIFSFLKEIIKTSKIENSKYLIISISPYTFLACIFLKLFKKKPIVYLRSDGYGEYKAILGFLGSIIYHFMFTITSMISYLISCRKYILKDKAGDLVSPSQLDESWLNNVVNAKFEKIKLLYIGRIKIEKGIYSLLDIIKGNSEIALSVVGAEKNLLTKINQSNVNVYEIEKNKQKLIKYYDDHNIFILPSFTEGHPMVLLEALARRRPVIIFEEIKHVVGDKKGIFVSKRNSVSLIETINHIKKNYNEINKQMDQNKLPTNKDFIKEFGKLISNSP
jgi:glycosyltransferase involved in cell wall biosynthesis|tara:strand:+ start:141 stop:1160 length:1020 start_codon:yes stop_codon:yes gene_type:complete